MQLISTVLPMAPAGHLPKYQYTSHGESLLAWAIVNVPAQVNQVRHATCMVMPQGVNNATCDHERCRLQVSLNDFIVRAVALALAEVPAANASWDAGAAAPRHGQGVDVAIAVATDKGLITPIVKGADKKSLTQVRPTTAAWGVSQSLG